jgi:uncharacterized SAM-binding protein YcdF (DUF218 family)
VRPRRRGRRRVPRLVILTLVIGVLLLAIGLALTARLFLWPRTDDARHVDAVVVFGARSRPERLPAGLRLIDRGLAPVLVLASAPLEHPLCRSPRRKRLEVICFTPDPFSTRGEARTVGRLAARRGWRSLVLVTSTWHVTRARMLLRRCFDGEVLAVAARPRDKGDTVESIVREWGGLFEALIWARGC